MSGAGKSTVCDIFRSNGFYIIDCDKICRQIVEKDHPCLKEIVCEFGSGILDNNGCLDRKKTGGIIFSDKVKRDLLNGIMYPYVSYIVINTIMSADDGYVVLDAPTLFESRLNTVCDLIVSVVADQNILLERICSRDGITAEMAEKRLSAQHDRDFFSKCSDYLIENNGAEKELLKKVMATINLIKEC